MQDSKQQTQPQPNADMMQQQNVETQLLQQVVELLMKKETKTVSQNIGLGSRKIYQTLTTHVLLLLAVFSGTGWFLTQNDSWKSYVQTGCRPDPGTYSERFVPSPPPNKPNRADGTFSWEALAKWQANYNYVLIIADENKNLDRADIDAKCGNIGKTD